MKDALSLSKENKANAQRLATLLNEFLEKDLKKEDLCTPDKIKNYWKILEENLWKREMSPPGGAFCIIHWHYRNEKGVFQFPSPPPTKSGDFWDEFMDIPGSLTAEEVGSMELLLWLHQHLRDARVTFERLSKHWPNSEDYQIRRLETIEQIDQRQFMDPINPKYHLFFTADLVRFMIYLRRCRDNLCRKWFIERSNKDFCCHHCAARYRKRMKEGKGDLQLSYRVRRPNRKK